MQHEQKHLSVLLQLQTFPFDVRFQCRIGWLYDFCNIYNLRKLINKPVCYKNPTNPSWIYLLLINCCKYFQNSNVVETGLSYYGKMVVTVVKTISIKIEPKILSYRYHECYSNARFRERVTSELSKVVIEKNNKGLNKLFNIWRKLLLYICST